MRPSRRRGHGRHHQLGDLEGLVGQHHLHLRLGLVPEQLVQLPERVHLDPVNGVGSGPYYLVSINKGVGYVLQANPAYGQPNCAGNYWCEPPAGMYAHTVNVFWEPSDQVGIQQYLQGQADFAGIQTSDTATLLNLQAAGKIGIQTVPTISIFFDPINMAVNLSTVPGYYTGSLNIPSALGGGHWSDFFSYVGLRQFLVNAFPYTQDLQQVLSVDGVSYGLNYGGAIPHFMGNYYANNVTWPAGQPDSNPADVGGAAWWWAQANDPTSPYLRPATRLVHLGAAV